MEMVEGTGKKSLGAFWEIEENTGRDIMGNDEKSISMGILGNKGKYRQGHLGNEGKI